MKGANGLVRQGAGCDTSAETSLDPALFPASIFARLHPKPLRDVERFSKEIPSISYGA